MSTNTNSKLIEQVVTEYGNFYKRHDALIAAWEVAEKAGVTKKEVAEALHDAGLYKNYATAFACFSRAINLNLKKKKGTSLDITPGDQVEKWLKLGAKIVAAG